VDRTHPFAARRFVACMTTAAALLCRSNTHPSVHVIHGPCSRTGPCGAQPGCATRVCPVSMLIFLHRHRSVTLSLYTDAHHSTRCSQVPRCSRVFLVPPPLCSGAFTTCRTCSCTFTACHTFRPTCLLTACHGTPDGLVCWFNRELRIVLQQLKGGCACYDFLIHFLSSRSTAESASPTCMYQRPTGGTSHAGSMVSLRNAASYSANMHCSLIHECESHGKAQRMRDAGTL
jgi:hypothetical protein